MKIRNIKNRAGGDQATNKIEVDVKIEEVRVKIREDLEKKTREKEKKRCKTGG